MDYFDLLRIHSNLFSNTNVAFKTVIGVDEIISWQEKKRSDLKKLDHPTNWGDIGIVFDDPYIVILRDLVEFPNGKRNGYIRLYNRAYLEGGAAGVVALPVKGNKILLMHNFRHATRTWHWEIPRGFGEAGVSAQDQVKAELNEEIGVSEVSLVDLGLFFNNTGLEGNPIYLFLARIDVEANVNIDIGVDELRWVSIEELENMIANSEITDGFTIAAYTRAKLKGLI